MTDTQAIATFLLCILAMLAVCAFTIAVIADAVRQIRDILKRKVDED